MSHTINEQPGAHPHATASVAPVEAYPGEQQFDSDGDGHVHLPSLRDIKNKLTTKDGWIGDYGQLNFVCLVCVPERGP